MNNSTAASIRVALFVAMAVSGLATAFAANRVVLAEEFTNNG